MSFQLDTAPYRDRIKQLNAEIATLKAAQAEHSAEVERLTEWRNAVLDQVKTIPEYETGQWCGNKEGWGFVFELIGWLKRGRDELRQQCAAKDEALRDLEMEISLRFGGRDRYDQLPNRMTEPLRGIVLRARAALNPKT